MSMYFADVCACLSPLAEPGTGDAVQVVLRADSGRQATVSGGRDVILRPQPESAAGGGRPGAGKTLTEPLPKPSCSPSTRNHCNDASTACGAQKCKQWQHGLAVFRCEGLRMRERWPIYMLHARPAEYPHCLSHSRDACQLLCTRRLDCPACRANSVGRTRRNLVRRCRCRRTT